MGLIESPIWRGDRRLRQPGLDWPGLIVREAARQATRTSRITSEGKGVGGAPFDGILRMPLRIGPRHMLVEAAWVAVEHHPYWKAEFARLARRMDEHKAVVAIARRLLVAVWHGPVQRALTERAADKHAE